MVRGPAHGSRVDVVELAATPWAPVLVTLSIFEELLFAVPHSRRDDSVVSSRDEKQPSQMEVIGTTYISGFGSG